MLRAFVEGTLDLLAPPRCAACELTLSAGARGFCEACGPLLEPDPTGMGGYLYGGPLADAIRRFKYGGRSELAGPLGELLAARARTHAGRVDLVVPVPLHRRRLRERGFDQAALLARPVACELGVRLAFALRRTRHTRAQAGLGASARASNVRGAFAAPPLSGRVLLIDDVRTTGSTLAACADALREAGAEEVTPLVLARAEG